MMNSSSQLEVQTGAATLEISMEISQLISSPTM